MVEFIVDPRARAAGIASRYRTVSRGAKAVTSATFAFAEAERCSCDAAARTRVIGLRR